jgi:hypothetical protein
MIYLKIETDSISNISKRAQKAEVTSNLETEEECDISKPRCHRLPEIFQDEIDAAADGVLFLYYFLLLIRIIYSYFVIAYEKLIENYHKCLGHY